jgi:hypothetical protein
LVFVIAIARTARNCFHQKPTIQNMRAKFSNVYR